MLQEPLDSDDENWEQDDDDVQSSDESELSDIEGKNMEALRRYFLKCVQTTRLESMIRNTAGGVDGRADRGHRPPGAGEDS